MLNELLRKWFGLNPIVCDSCEILHQQLEKSERERSELLVRLLEKDKTEPVPQTRPDEPDVPIKPQFIPWRVRQQMLESEDRKSAQLIRDRKKEIDDLEKELGLAHEVDRGSSGGVVAEVK
jgi:hypothetical protein